MSTSVIPIQIFHLYQVAVLGGKIALTTARETALPLGKRDAAPSPTLDKLNRNNAKLSVASWELSSISKVS